MTDTQSPPATDASRRLAALSQYAVLDTLPEPAFDDIAALAAQICGAPVALVTFVDDRRQFFKARLGMEASEAPLEGGFCTLVVHEAAVLVVPDARADPRFADAPAVMEQGLRFYAGVPLTDAAGQVLGALCVLDRQPRTLAAEQLAALHRLARQVIGQLDLRLAVRRAQEADQRRRAIFESGVDLALIATDAAAVVTDVNAGAERILGWAAQEIRGRSIDVIFTPEDHAQDRLATEMQGALAVGHARDDRWHLRRDGSRVWVTGEMLPLRAEDGSHIGFLKVIRDLTAARRIAEEQRAEAERYAALARLQRELAAAPDDNLETILDLVVERALSVVSRADGASIDLREGETLTYRAVAGRARGFRNLRVPFQGSLSGACLAEGRPVHATDTETDPRAHLPTTRAIGIRSIIVLPVHRHGTVIGVLKLMAGTPNAFTEADVIAGQMVTGLLAAGFGTIAEAEAIAALRDSEARFRELADNISQFAWTADADGALTWYNQRWYDYTGTTFAEMQGSGWTAAHHPDHVEGVRQRFGRAVASGEPWEDTFPLRSKDGRYRWFLTRARPIRDDSGAVVRWFGTNTDVTDLREAEAALAASEAKFQAIVDSIDQMIWSAAADGRHDYYNQRWYDFTGWPVGTDFADLDGSAALALFHPDDYQQARARWRHSLATGEVYEVEYRMRHHTGAYRWVLGRAQPVRDAQGGVLRWYGTCTDIHDRKMAEAALRHLNETLEQRVAEEVAERGRAEAALHQSQKMEAVGQLTGGLAHDFNNLLTGISGSLELIQTRVAQGRVAELDRYTVAAQSAAKRAAALTHRLLAFSRRQTLDPRPTNINRLVAGMEDLVRRTVGPAAALEVIAAGGLWNTRVDSNQLENALLNLCINARDAMPNGGRLTLETANRWLDGRVARELDLAAGQYVSLSVSDTGTGMTPDVAARAFDPFFTTKPIGQGTGLGLSMIYGFARQSGGQARIYSEPGHGTTVCIYLPRWQGHDVEVDAAPQAVVVAAPPQGETVLVVDDEPAVRMLVTDVLEDLGYHAIEAADGTSALQVLQSDSRIDLLVTDVGLPGGMNGRQVADAGQALRPALKVLFMTGYAENAVVGDGHLRPGMQVLTKPFAMDDLASRIRELVAAQPLGAGATPL